ncbi:MAG: hypothetical protein FIA99_19770 [Ruminiclostridium sp.]|nr:hypothetical protein [Ruminiclostridium sp.]
MTINQKDKQIFRTLAKQYREVAFLDTHKRTIEHWKRINSLNPIRPMIMIDQIPWHEMNVNDELTLMCEDELLKSLEWKMRSELYKWKRFPCDMAFYPFLQVPKVYTDTGTGVESHISQDEINYSEARTHTYSDQLPDEAALEKLHNPVILFDRKSTALREELVNELIGDIIPVKMSGVTIWAAVWDRIVFWRGATPVLYDLIDRPEFVCKLMKKITGIEMDTLDQLEEQNLLEYEQDLIHCAGAYSYELPGKDFDAGHVKAKNCWVAGAAQIFSEVSPAMHDEFEIEYMKPYYERFGLVNYGCCDPLHHKIDIIRKIKNVRTISISPWANVQAAAENMGKDYVMARKPNPSFVAMDTFDDKIITDDIKTTLKACVKNNTPCEFILKDITTVRNDPQRLSNWYKIVKSTIENY